MRCCVRRRSLGRWSAICLLFALDTSFSVRWVMWIVALVLLLLQNLVLVYRPCRILARSHRIDDLWYMHYTTVFPMQLSNSDNQVSHLGNQISESGNPISDSCSQLSDNTGDTQRSCRNETRGIDAYQLMRRHVVHSRSICLLSRIANVRASWRQTDRGGASGDNHLHLMWIMRGVKALTVIYKQMSLFMNETPMKLTALLCLKSFYHNRTECPSHPVRACTWASKQIQHRLDCHQLCFTDEVLHDSCSKTSR